MNCPQCAEAMTQKRAKTTQLGPLTVFCPQCRRTFNQRTSTFFHHLAFPTARVLLAVVWRVRSQLSVRGVAELCVACGCAFTHQAMQTLQPARSH
jgi:putative transposase